MHSNVLRKVFKSPGADRCFRNLIIITPKGTCKFIGEGAELFAKTKIELYTQLLDFQQSINVPGIAVVSPLKHCHILRQIFFIDIAKRP